MPEGNTDFDFEDIRPYRDEEVAGVIKQVLVDREFLDTIANMKFPRLARVFPWLVRPLIARVLHSELGGVTDVRQLQELIATQLYALLARSADSLEVTGAEALEAGQAYLFFSNHRDIAMDPAMVNLSLYEQGLDTVRIAIGDNLLSKPFVSDLMRLNKSFIVKRSATARREKLAALQQLSAYIQYSLFEDRQSIWIAQREGRAKDGVDTTETALLKMLVLNKPKQESFGDALARMPLVPVSISYEWDPCDALKAHELHALQTEGTYVKDKHEDISSIYRGIVGDKGHIVVAFGERLVGPFADAGQAADHIDRQILLNYRLQASHLLAYEQLFGAAAELDIYKKSLGEIDWAAKQRSLRARLSPLSESQQKIMLEAYAAPVRRRLALGE
ncbi:MAG TPA: cytochrome C oxidase Cbb3 [Porticoccaceae bacterium]|nr:cytochrome C oxidase Cbb3 [Porticoccaceae bacterium]HCO59456.1 cytochrome C oxidase Cbb3 [Porticoccaceae bacterium]